MVLGPEEVELPGQKSPRGTPVEQSFAHLGLEHPDFELQRGDGYRAIVQNVGISTERVPGRSCATVELSGHIGLCRDGAAEVYKLFSLLVPLACRFHP